ncbi:MAG: glycosyltransferase [Patescibacteria group bacterium]
MDLSIVIVNYKSQDKLRRLLASLRAADFSGIQSEIIVVENNSGDDLGDLEALAKVIKSPRNLGMGGGNNLGISQSQGEYVAIMNPDTLVKADSLKILYNYIKQHPEVGLVGPKLVYPDGSLQYSCSRFPGFWIPILRRTFLGDYFRQVRDSFMMLDFNHDLISEVDWLMGSCLMFKRDLRFDERYFMYFEDTDLARQVRSRGLKVIYNPEAVVVHDHQRASAELPWYQAIFKSRLAWLHILSWWKYFLKWGLKSKI